MIEISSLEIVLGEMKLNKILFNFFSSMNQIVKIAEQHHEH